VFLGGVFQPDMLQLTPAILPLANWVYKITIQNPLFAATSGIITMTDTLPEG